MCGFAGFIDATPRRNGEELAAIADDMNARFAWRGPDDSGTWVDETQGVALGHRRLSVIDLSPLGHQPMASASGRYVIVYNGEVYNFKELRAELEAGGQAFKGHSDTEVIVEACAAWGVRAAVERLIGMFAFALWDRETRTLTLVRDRLGIKPLYWGWVGKTLFFGSQPGAFAAHPSWRPEIDRDALASYVRHAYVPGPHSIYEGIEKLEPGCLVEIPLGAKEKPRPNRYWDARTVAVNGTRARWDFDDTAAIGALDGILRKAVKRRMIADVPLGAFLSGGIDSSTVAALMQAQSAQPIKTFSIGFHEKGYDEARHAKAVANHLGTDHTELYVQSDHARDALMNMATWYDEPFADSSQVPTFLVSEMARKHVTVALSGDGGDELFSGYNRYFFGETMWSYFGKWPRPARLGVASLLRTLPVGAWDGLFNLVPSAYRPPQAGDKVYKLAHVLGMEGQADFYRHLVSQWKDPAGVVLNAREPRGVLWDETVRDDIPDFSESMQFLDTVTYLPDDILTKVDRASMAVSLEARVPLLDHEVVEFAWRLPKHMKIRKKQGKWLLRQVLYNYLPKALVERPKMGFGVPIDRWLREDLRDWGEALLDPIVLRDEGYFDVETVRRAWDDHMSGRRNLQHPLWAILMFQSWKNTHLTH